MKNILLSFKTLLISLLLTGTSIAQSYTENFSGGVVPSNFSPEAPYTISNTLVGGNNQLKVIVSKGSLFGGLNITFPAPLNLSNPANRTFSYDIRTDTLSRFSPYVVQLYVFSNSSITGGFSKVIYPSSKFRRITNSFADPSVSAGIDWTNVTGFQFVFSPLSGLNCTSFIDNISVGAGTPAQPYFESIPTLYTLANSPAQNFRIQNIYDATNNNQNVTFTGVSSNPALITNITFVGSPIKSNFFYTWNAPNSNSGLINTNKPVFFRFTPGAGQFGMATVTVTATTVSTVPGITIQPSTSVFTIVVDRNNPPQIQEVPTVLEVGSGITSTFKFSKITTGNPYINQLVTISGVSSDGAVLPTGNIVVNYPNNTGTDASFSITPNSFGALPVRTCNIAFTVRDNGGTALGGTDQSIVNIPVLVYPVYYKKPTFNNIPNQSTIITAGTQYVTITGITDGNGGSNVFSIAAATSNPAVVNTPLINYTTGKNFAVLSYNAATAGTAVISVTATNQGAPANSNGNSSLTKIFTILGLNPPLSGYSEDFSSAQSRSITGQNYYTDGGISKSNWNTNVTQEKWYCEGQGSVMTGTINTTTGVLSVVVNKTNGFDGGKWFAGLWYRPSPGNIYDFRTTPRMSVTLSASANTSVAIDLFDINGVRYGLSSFVNITTTPQTYTFCYNGIPSAGFDFTKVNSILFNFPAQPVFANFAGTVNISNVKVGDQSVGSCPPLATTTVEMDTIGVVHHLVSQSGVKTLTLTGVNAGTSPAFGLNTNPVSLVINSSGPISPINVGSVANGIATLNYTSPASSGTTTVTVTGSATSALSNSMVFSIVVSNNPGSTAVANINNNVNALHPDGYRGQTMDGFGATLNGNVGSDGGPSENFQPSDVAVRGIIDQGMTMARMAIPPNFEYKNDNDDPNYINFEAFDVNSLRVEQYQAYQAAGVQKFIASCWTTPIWTKINKSDQVPTGAGFVVTNTIDTAYVQEVAEFFAAYVLLLKQKTGIELYALDFVNEPQFNEPYASSLIDPQQYILLMNAIVAKFNVYGIKTIIFGPETLGQDNGQYINAFANDPVGRNNISAHARHNYAADGIGAGSLTWGPILTATRDIRFAGGMTRYLNNPLTPIGSTGNGGIGIPVWQTETSGQPWNWNGAFNYANAMHSAIAYGNVSAWTFWTFVSGTTQDSYAQTSADGNIPIYYAQKHYSKFIEPGAVRVPTTLATSTGVYLTAFQNSTTSGGNTLALVALNTNSSWAQLSLTGTNLPAAFRVFQSYRGYYWQELSTISSVINMPPSSIITLWGGANALLAASSVSVTGAGGATTINSPGGTLQMAATVLPTNVPDGTVTWSVITGTGNATINNTGMLMGVSNGTVTVRATSNNTPSVFGNLVVTISGQYEKVLALTVAGVGGNIINTSGGTRSITGIFNPATATNKNINWSINPPSGMAVINGQGVVTALTNGFLTVTGISQDNNTVSGVCVITITGQAVPVTSATVSGAGGINVITTSGGILAMNYAYSPSNANTNTLPGWSIQPFSGVVNIDAVSGVLTATGNGLVTVTGTFGAVVARRVVTVSGQFVAIPVSSASVSGLSGNVITAAGGTLTMTGVYSPSNANTNTLVGWSAVITGGIATFNNSTGVLTASNNGNGVVTITGSYGAVNAIRMITISGQYVATPVVSATVSGLPSNSISIASGSITLTGVYSPSNANVNTLVGWTATIPSSIATFNNSTGVLTASNNGNGIVSITGTYGSVSAIRLVTISGQFTVITVTSATVTGTGGSSVITSAGGSLQMLSTYSPSNANTNTLIGWSLTDPTGQNSVNPTTGLLQANTNGNGVVTVTGTYGGGIVARRVVTISGQAIPVASATVTGTGGSTIITATGGSLQMISTYSPSNANTNTVIGWSLTDPSGQNSLNPTTGLLQANTNGNGVVTVTGTYGGGVVARRVVTISGQAIPVASATVTGTGNVNIISVAGGSLTMVGSFSPSNANTNTLVGWSINDPAGNANFNAGTGTLQAIKNGNVTITGSYGAISASRVITLSNQPTAISISGANTISTNLGTAQMFANFTPVNSSTTGTTWNVLGAAGTISGTGLLQALTDGIVTVVGISQLNSAISGTRVVTISGQAASVVSVTGLTLTGGNIITSVGGNLTIGSIVSPTTATNKTISWSVNPAVGVVNNTPSSFSISLTATGNGIVTITGTSSNPSIFQVKIITVTGYPVLVSAATVSGLPSNIISVGGGTITMSGVYAPANANTNTLVGWNANIVGGIASFNNSTGVLTAANNGNGVVTVTGTYGAVVTTRLITISGQNIQVASATVSGLPANTISTPGGSITMSGTYLPVNANTGTLVGWNANIVGGIASFNNTTRVLTATNNGNGTVTITGTYGSVSAIRIITISGQFVGIPVTSATVSGLPSNAISTGGGVITVTGSYSPSNANISTLVGWSANIVGGIASFNNSTGVLTAANNGNGVVTVTGTYGSVTGIRLITISGQFVGIPVTSATVTGTGNVNLISIGGGNLQMVGTYSPSNANTGTLVGWSLFDPSSVANLSGSGLLTANNNGNGVVTVTGTYGGSVTARRVVTISGQYVAIPVTSGTVSGTGNLSVISTTGGTLQMVMTYSPSNANTGTFVGWALNDPASIAGLSLSGLLQANGSGDGVVTVTGTINSILVRKVITISNQNIPVTSVTISGTSNTISTGGGFVDMSSGVIPTNATNQSVTYSLIQSPVIASLSSNRVLAANNGNGVITVVATSVGNPSATASFVITISGQNIPLVSLSLVNNLTATGISTPGGGLQFNPVYNPSNTNQVGVSWSLSDPSNVASLSAGGFLQARDNGNAVVTVTAISTQNGSIKADFVVTITGQTITISGISVGTQGNVSAISTNGGEIQMTSSYLPLNVTPNQTAVGWSLVSVPVEAIATIDATGRLTAIGNGVITVTGVSAVNASLSDLIVITITGQKVKDFVITPSGVSFINTKGGSKTIVKLVQTPVSSDNYDQINWSIQPTNIATFNPTDLSLTAANFGIGFVTITGTMVNSTVSSYTIVRIVNQDSIPRVANINTALGVVNLNPKSITGLVYSVLGQTNLGYVDTDGRFYANDAGDGTVTVLVYKSNNPDLRVLVTVNITNQSTSMVIVPSDPDFNPVANTLVPKFEMLLFSQFSPNDFVSLFNSTAIGWNISSIDGIVASRVDDRGYTLINAVKNGFVTISGVYLNNTSITASIVIKVDSVTTSLNKQTELGLSINVFPNPVVNKVYFENLTGQKIDLVELYSSSGSFINSFTKVTPEGLDVSDFPVGKYELVITIGNNRISKSIIIQ
jgi:hypothetical protein